MYDNLETARDRVNRKNFFARMDVKWCALPMSTKQILFKILDIRVNIAKFQNLEGVGVPLNINIFRKIFFWAYSTPSDSH